MLIETSCIAMTTTVGQTLSRNSRQLAIAAVRLSERLAIAAREASEAVDLSSDWLWLPSACLPACLPGAKKGKHRSVGRTDEIAVSIGGEKAAIFYGNVD